MCQSCDNHLAVSMRQSCDNHLAVSMRQSCDNHLAVSMRQSCDNHLAVSMRQSCDETYPSHCHSFLPESGHGVFFMEIRKQGESMCQNGYKSMQDLPSIVDQDVCNEMAK